jgi:hypothetical protein
MQSVLATCALSLGLAAASAAFAEPAKEPLNKPAPQAVKMSDAQLDNVAAGQALIDVTAVDLVDVNNNNIAVNIPVNAAAAINVLGGATGAVSTQRPGRILQTQ